MKILFLILSASSLPISVFAGDLTNCHNDERIAFSCTSGKRVISVCAAPLKSDADYLEYRFSSNGKTPFSYRADQSHADHLFHRAEVVGASSMSTMIWFNNGGYTYILNDPIKGYPSVTVRDASKEISRIQCTGNFIGDSDLKNMRIREETSEEYFNLLKGSEQRP